jgi:cell division septation protein DedD
MKQCPRCHRSYDDDSLRFCLEDGAALAEPYDSAATLIVPRARPTEARTEVLPATSPSVDQPARTKAPWTNYVIIALLALIAGGGVVWLLRSNNDPNSNPDPVKERASGEDNRAAPAPSTQPTGTLPGSSNASVPATPAATPTAGASTAPPARGKWFVIIGSFAKAQRQAAEQKLQEAQAAGYNVTIIDTDNYPGLSGGYWAVVSGPVSEAEAKDIKFRMMVDYTNAYVKSGW